MTARIHGEAPAFPPPSERIRTIAAYVRGHEWLRLAEEVTGADGSTRSRPTFGVTSDFTYHPIPNGMTAERLTAIHMEAVRLAGDPPADDEIRKLGPKIAAAKRIATAIRSAMAP